MSYYVLRCYTYDPQYGATPLHKAVLFYQPKIVKLIAEKYRITTRSKDQVSQRNIKVNLSRIQVVPLYALRVGNCMNKLKLSV